MAINVVYQPPAGLMGEYAYQSSALKQARNNLDDSIQRNLQAQVQNQHFNANQQSLAQRNYEFNSGLAERQRYNNLHAEANAVQSYQQSRADFDDIVEDGVKNGWLRLEPEQKQELRKLAAADSEIIMRDDLDSPTKLKMLNAIQARRRSVIPSVIPGFDRPSKTHEQADQNTFIVGADGVSRAPQPGVPLKPGDQIWFMGKRNGVQNPISLQPKEQKQEKVSEKYWSPDLNFNAKFAMAQESLKEHWGTISDQMFDQYKVATEKKPGVNVMGDINGGVVNAPYVKMQPNGKYGIAGMRDYDLSDPKQQLEFIASARLLKSPEVAFTRDDVIRKIQQNDADMAVGGEPGGWSLPQQPQTQQPQQQQAMPTMTSGDDELMSLIQNYGEDIDKWPPEAKQRVSGILGIQ